MSSFSHPPDYHSFLLRVWRDNEASPWRVQLEDPHTGERRGFATLEKLFEFLNNQAEIIPAESKMNIK